MHRLGSSARQMFTSDPCLVRPGTLSACLHNVDSAPCMFLCKNRAVHDVRNAVRRSLKSKRKDERIERILTVVVADRGLTPIWRLTSAQLQPPIYGTLRSLRRFCLCGALWKKMCRSRRLERSREDAECMWAFSWCMVPRTRQDKI